MNSQGPRPQPLDPADDAGIENAVRTVLDLPAEPAPIEQACEDRKSNFFQILFFVKPKRENTIECWKKLAEESVAEYVRNWCTEGVLVQAVRDNILRLEVAIWFSVQSRDGAWVRSNLKKRNVQKSLPESPKDWDVTSKILGQAEDARNAIYENLRARTAPQIHGGLRLVVHTAPRAQQQLSASLIASAVGPAAGVTVSGGGGAAAGGRAAGADSGICAGPAAGDGAKFFTVTITVKQAEPCGGDRRWIDNMTGAVEKHVSRNLPGSNGADAVGLYFVPDC